jgi:hypothetical protein
MNKIIALCSHTNVICLDIAITNIHSFFCAIVPINPIDTKLLFSMILCSVSNIHICMFAYISVSNYHNSFNNVNISH